MDTVKMNANLKPCLANGIRFIDTDEIWSDIWKGY